MIVSAIVGIYSNTTVNKTLCENTSLLIKCTSTVSQQKCKLLCRLRFKRLRDPWIIVEHICNTHLLISSMIDRFKLKLGTHWGLVTQYLYLTQVSYNSIQLLVYWGQIFVKLYNKHNYVTKNTEFAICCKCWTRPTSATRLRKLTNQILDRNYVISRQTVFWQKYFIINE